VTCALELAGEGLRLLFPSLLLPVSLLLFLLHLPYLLLLLLLQVILDPRPCPIFMLLLPLSRPNFFLILLLCQHPLMPCLLLMVMGVGIQLLNPSSLQILLLRVWLLPLLLQLLL
jgi:hypothetical protein